MIERTKKIFEGLYTALPRLFLLVFLLIFYVVIWKDLSEATFKLGIANSLISEISENNLKTGNNRIVNEYYHCLSVYQFRSLISAYDFKKGSSDNISKIRLDRKNKEYLSKYKLDSNNLLLQDGSIDTIKFLQQCLLSFKVELTIRFNNLHNKFDKEDIKGFKLPVIDVYLPKSFTPNILITLIIFQLIQCFVLISNLQKIIKNVNIQRTELKDTIQVYILYFSPSAYLLLIYYCILLVFTSTFVSCLWRKDFLASKPIFLESNILTFTHNYYGIVNLIATILICFLLLIRIIFTLQSIRKIVSTPVGEYDQTDQDHPEQSDQLNPVQTDQSHPE